MKRMGQEEGASIAVVASLLLLVAAASSVVLTIATGVLVGVEHRDMNWIATSTILPTVLQFVWLSMVVGTAGAVVALAVYGYRARWFWRCMVAASVMWLVSPPLHSVIGLIALIALVKTRKAFVDGRMAGMVS